MSIRVFNRDFIDKNISFDPTGSCTPIVYVSEVDIETKNRLNSFKSQTEPLAKEHQHLKNELENAERAEDRFRRSVGQNISKFLTVKASNDWYHTYNKRKVKETITQIGINNFDSKILSDEDETNYKLTIRSDPGKHQSSFPKFLLPFPFEGRLINTFRELFDEVEKLLQREVVSQMLDRLKNDQALNNWVKKGFDLHLARDEKGKCLFCQKPLDDDFWDSLSRHFNEDYKRLEGSIIQLQEKISELEKSEIPVTNDALRFGLGTAYTNEATNLNQHIRKINAWRNEVLNKLETKRSNLLTVVSSPSLPGDFLNMYNQTITKLNTIISEHNHKIQNHTDEVKDAKEKLEAHFIATAIDDQDYKRIATDLAEASKKEETALKAVKQNLSEIANLEKQTSNIGNAINKINQYLREFFGREEIKLELDEDKRGYQIRREGYIAKNLSEGEKTAIAFSYFIAKDW